MVPHDKERGFESPTLCRWSMGKRAAERYLPPPFPYNFKKA